MQKYKFNFSKNQLRKIAIGYKTRSGVALQLKYNNLINGVHEIVIGSDDIKRIENAKKSRKGLRLVLSYNEIKNIKQGGFLPWLFAGLGALGALMGGGAAVTNTVINKKQKEKELEELKRHNKAMEGRGIRKKSTSKRKNLKKSRTSIKF
jgi:hypothetical protein